ncbi:MAG: pyridoxamine 5-phosphate oxidase-related FMN-binding protein [Frankiales bacterium]|nr:pyridoxamine 5-phosphate oxidase-related FMN-binding protein [Frankiales bacterium]
MRPPQVLQRLAGLPGSGLVNARRSALEVALAVAERVVLTKSLDEAPEAGALRRMDADDCWSLLDRHTVGRLAYLAREGTPDVVPVNYAVHGDDVLVCSGRGPKLQAAERRELVAFEVDEIDETARSGRSVVVLGTAQRLSDPQVAALVRDGARIPHPWADGPRQSVIRLRPRRVAGRSVG